MRPVPKDPYQPGVAPSGRGTLNHEAIIEAAVRFMDEHGILPLTMRRLGAELGVEAMALYRYLPSRDAVLDGVVDAVMVELYDDPDVHPDAAASWQDYLQRLAHGVRGVALLHPQIFPLVATRPPSAPWLRPPLRSLHWAESFLDALIGSGFSDEAAVAAYRGFTSFLLGHLLLEVSALGADVGPVPEADPDEPVQPSELLDHPHLLRLQSELSEDRSAEEFDDSLESLLDRITEQHRT